MLLHNTIYNPDTDRHNRENSRIRRRQKTVAFPCPPFFQAMLRRTEQLVQLEKKNRYPKKKKTAALLQGVFREEKIKP
jgi:hypothetical protein